MPPATVTRSGRRASPLAPDARRAALVAATLPLLLEHGPAVSTRAIAEAAGVAEGTLFRVFPSKEALVQAAVAAALDERPLLAELAAVDGDLDLRARLVVVAELLQRRIAGVVRLMMAVGPQLRPPPPDGCGPPQHRSAAAVAAVAALVEPDAAALRVPPHELARLLRQLAFASAHPVISDGSPMTPDEIVAVLLDGVLSHPDRETTPC